MKTHPPLKRLSQVWIPDAVYFITTCIQGRKKVLDSDLAATVLIGEWKAASNRHGWRIGRYVIMPDHVHFFCAEAIGGARRPLSGFMNAWKTWTSRGLHDAGVATPPVWQRNFFDHVLRRNESYAEKWLYVRENPVRAGLVRQAEAWPFQGWIDFDVPGPS